MNCVVCKTTSASHFDLNGTDFTPKCDTCGFPRLRRSTSMFIPRQDGFILALRGSDDTLRLPRVDNNASYSSDADAMFQFAGRSMNMKIGPTVHILNVIKTPDNKLNSLYYVNWISGIPRYSVEKSVSQLIWIDARTLTDELSINLTSSINESLLKGILQQRQK